MKSGPVASGIEQTVMTSGQIDIRLATAGDAALLAAMSRDLVEVGVGWSWVPARIARHIRSPESVVLVAQGASCVAGFAIMRFGAEEAHLDLLAVRPPFRRAGVGRRLIDWLEESALVAGVSLIYLELRAGNDAALRFYKSLGYCQVKRVPGYYGGRETAICMARDLWSSPLADTM